MTQTDRQITIRVLDDGDSASLQRLAQRDSSQIPAAPRLGAEIGSELVAAISLREPAAAPIADPFTATSEARQLLQLRRKQLRGRERPRARGLLAHLRRTPRARGALAGSPPGGGSHLLQLRSLIPNDPARGDAPDQAGRRTRPQRVAALPARPWVLSRRRRRARHPWVGE